MLKILVVILMVVSAGCKLPAWMPTTLNQYSPSGRYKYTNWQAVHDANVERAESEALLERSRGQ